MKTCEDEGCEFYGTPHEHVELTYDYITKHCSFIEAQHGHGPDMFFYTYRCKQIRRLKFIDRSYRKSRTTEREWYVDGNRVELPVDPLIQKPIIEEACRLLKIPPEISEDEKKILREVPWEFTSIPNRGEWTVKNYLLHEKGLVEWKDGKIRRLWHEQVN